MKFIKSLFAVAAIAVSSSAFATPVTLSGSEQNLQTILNGLHSCGAPCVGSVAPNVNTGQASESGLFQIEASGASIATMIIEVAGNAGINSFGIYDPGNPSSYLQLFSGAVSSGGTLAMLSMDEDNKFAVNFGESVQFSSNTFGYYLGRDNGGPLFYSQASLNGDDDHMVAYQGDFDTIKLPGRGAGKWGASSFILAWEDLPFGSSDLDYNDMVVYVESVSAVPEPGSLALLGLGLAGLAAASRRKQRAA